MKLLTGSKNLAAWSLNDWNSTEPALSPPSFTSQFILTLKNYAQEQPQSLEKQRWASDNWRLTGV
ncbi:hypothetical protein PM082_021255 [Marasmius tenuissimus]|nr:hypothetical protein PM082_021255 [Marasmius tenuissimus]